MQKPVVCFSTSCPVMTSAGVDSPPRRLLSSAPCRHTTALLFIALTALVPLRLSLHLLPVSLPLPLSTALQGRGVVLPALNTAPWLRRRYIPGKAYTAPHATTPHRCVIFGSDGAASPRSGPWRYNTRIVCLTPAVCIRPSTPDALPHLYFAGSVNHTSCDVLHADLTPVSEAERARIRLPRRDCLELQRRRVHCAQGKFRGRTYPTCPVSKPLPDALRPRGRDFEGSDGRKRDAWESEQAQWLSDDTVAVFIPALPHLGNIFHFSYIAATLGQLMPVLPRLLAEWQQSLTSNNNDTRPIDPDTALPAPRLEIVFRGQDPWKGWPTSVLELVLRYRLSGAPFQQIRVRTTDESFKHGGISHTNTQPALCARTAVLLGDRSQINTWPYANDSAVHDDGTTVPAESVFLRRALYEGLGIRSTLPRAPGFLDTGHLRPVPRTAILELPPATIGYARRDSEPDPPRGEAVVGATRRFSDADDAWFVLMLRAEASAQGFGFREFKLTARDSVASQARTFSAVGVVAGIHGANLVNALFVRPFGALLEILPGGLDVQCYRAGMNGGLFYQRVTADNATAEESNCPPDDFVCVRRPRGKRVKIGRAAVRDDVRLKVRRAIQHVARLRQRFPRGVPVRFVDGEGTYEIDYDA